MSGQHLQFSAQTSETKKNPDSTKIRSNNSMRKGTFKFLREWSELNLDSHDEGFAITNKTVVCCNNRRNSQEPRAASNNCSKIPQFSLDSLFGG